MVRQCTEVFSSRVVQLLERLLLLSALLTVRNRVEAQRREQELKDEAEREGKPTDDIKVPNTVNILLFVMILFE